MAERGQQGANLGGTATIVRGGAPVEEASKP